VAAGSWAARSFLLGGSGGLRPGEPADLVVVRDDPRRDPRVLLDPLLVVLRGRVVRAA
jgi:imidazolonepropionase-like amidohydrolase